MLIEDTRWRLLQNKFSTQTLHVSRKCQAVTLQLFKCCLQNVFRKKSMDTHLTNSVMLSTQSNCNIPLRKYVSSVIVVPLKYQICRYPSILSGTPFHSSAIYNGSPYRVRLAWFSYIQYWFWRKKYVLYISWLFGVFLTQSNTVLKLPLHTPV